MPSEFVDPYIDRNTGILANLPGARTWDELKQAEGELVGGPHAAVVLQSAKGLRW